MDITYSNSENIDVTYNNISSVSGLPESVSSYIDTQIDTMIIENLKYQLGIIHKEETQKQRDLRNKRENDKYRNMIEWVHFNESKRATSVKWKDGSVTVVRAADSDKFDPYIGVAMCMAKKMCGNRAVYTEIIQKWGDTFESEEMGKISKITSRKYPNTVTYKGRRAKREGK